MAIVAQLNPLRFYANKLSRQWENTNNERRLVIYPMYLDGSTLKCKVPQFSVEINEAVSTVSAKIYNCAGTEITTLSTFTTIAKTGYSQIIYLGSSITLDDIDTYEIVLTINGIDYWSDFYEWTTELDKTLKIKVESSKILLGHYEYEMIDTIHEFYLKFKPITSNTYLKEGANESDAITNINYGSSALLRGVKVLGNEPIFMFLRSLRVLSCNGLVTFTYKFIDYEADDIVIDQDQDHGNADLIDIKIEFKVLTESVSVCNTSA